MGIRLLFLCPGRSRTILKNFALVLFFLLLVLPGQVRAELTLGALKGQNCLPSSAGQAEKLGAWLQTQLGEPVRVRIFNSPTLLHQWMNRYRQVDFGLLPVDFIRRFHPIEFQQIITYEATNPKLHPTVLAGRRGLQRGALQRVQDLLLTLDTDPEGTALLTAMGVAAYQAPGGDRVVLHVPEPAARKTRLVRRKEARPPAPGTAPKSQAASRPAPALPQPAPVRVVKVADKPAAGKAGADQAAKGVAKAEPETKRSVSTAPRQDTPPAVPSGAGAANPAHDKPSPPGAQKAPSPRSAPPAGPSLDRQHYSRHTSPQQSVDEKAFTGRGKRYLWVIAVILLVGGMLKLLLILQKRPRPRPSVSLASVVIQHDWPQDKEPKTPAREESTAEPAEPPREAPPPASAPETDSPVQAAATRQPPSEEQEDGHPSAVTSLEPLFKPPVQVPRVLARIAQEKLSGALRVTAEHNEKVLTFENGLLTSAASQNLSTKTQSGFLMNKLGYLLIRQGKITEEDRDRALVLCEGNPHLRLGEALIQLGALKRSELIRSLQDQAKMILHSLIVFPEGVFHFEPGHPAIAPEDNLRLPVEDFLREAKTHEHEWDNIRAMIPSLDTVLEFAPGGRDKVNAGRLTVHQKFVLSLIDGRRRIRDICVDATMLDYELYRFLYLMVKADILRRVESKKDSPAA